MKPDKFHMPRKDSLACVKDTFVACIYTEARLEGINVRYSEVRQMILAGKTVEGLSVDDTIKINNLKQAWQFVLDTIDVPVDLRYIRQVNAEVERHLDRDAGKLRNIDVRISGTNWKPDLPDENTAWEAVKAILDSDTSTTDEAIDMMLYLMRSQLFVDGNKRTAQLIANKLLLEGGAGVLAVLPEQLEDFRELLVDFYESNDAARISDFLYTCIYGDSHFWALEGTASEAEDVPPPEMGR